MALQQLLNNCGVEAADEATDGIQALKLVQSKCQLTKAGYKLILMDYSMPQQNGPECTANILDYMRRSAPELPRPYICCVSAYDSAEFKG